MNTSSLTGSKTKDICDGIYEHDIIRIIFKIFILFLEVSEKAREAIAI